ncbi:MAG: hypothetical protein IBJ18_06040 [Phycisphaerales bacterium]|nr:hypothetical protein [Phycisphaerales bacterium]
MTRTVQTAIRTCGVSSFGDGRARTVVFAAGVVLGAAALMSTLGGCYSRVVGASGPGASQYNVQEPYQKDTWIDEQIYGEREKRPSR